LILEDKTRTTFNQVRDQYTGYFERHIKLPQTIIVLMFNEWINPHANKFLIEGEYKKYCKNPNYLRYEYLSSEECQYLITRFQKWFDNSHNKVQPTVFEGNN